MQSNLDQLEKVVHQRYPFLMIDKIVEFQKGKKIVGIKNISVNEPFFQGHFPEKKIMPGVLIAESMAQAASVLLYDQKEKEKIFYIGSIKARFLHPVVPGDQLKIEVTPVKVIKDSGIVHAEAYVGDKLVARANFSFKAQ